MMSFLLWLTLEVAKHLTAERLETAAERRLDLFMEAEKAIVAKGDADFSFKESHLICMRATPTYACHHARGNMAACPSSTLSSSCSSSSLYASSSSGRLFPWIKSPAPSGFRGGGSTNCRRKVTLRCKWPDASFVQDVRARFEGLGSYAKPVADAEEARVLLSIGYTWVDVRSDLEVEARGKVRGCVHLPFTLTRKRYDPEEKKSVVDSSPNPKFLETCEKLFRDKEASLLLVADSNGRSGGQEALMLLENAGYVNLVGVVGGFNAYWRVFDAKGARRPSRGAFLEDPMASGSSQGIFAGES